MDGVGGGWLPSGPGGTGGEEVNNEGDYLANSGLNASRSDSGPEVSDIAACGGGGSVGRWFGNKAVRSRLEEFINWLNLPTGFSAHST